MVRNYSFISSFHFTFAGRKAARLRQHVCGISPLVLSSLDLPSRSRRRRGRPSGLVPDGSMKVLHTLEMVLDGRYRSTCPLWTSHRLCRDQRILRFSFKKRVARRSGASRKSVSWREDGGEPGGVRPQLRARPAFARKIIKMSLSGARKASHAGEAVKKTADGQGKDGGAEPERVCGEQRHEKPQRCSRAGSHPSPQSCH